jgi:RHS repeat-associated protein
LTFDANGNMTTDQEGRQFIWDAWNRLVQVKDSGGATIISFEYDAAGRRSEQVVSGSTRDFYFAGGQVVEERVGGTARIPYVWSPAYVDAIIARDRDADSNGSLETREYYQQDANQNVTAVISSAGAPLERYVHTAYGVQTVLNASWSAIGGSTIDSEHGHQGLRLVDEIDLHDNRRRWYSATLMRFVSIDPIGFAGGYTNLYVYVGNGPVGAVVDQRRPCSAEWIEDQVMAVNAELVEVLSNKMRRERQNEPVPLVYRPVLRSKLVGFALF